MGALGNMLEVSGSGDGCLTNTWKRVGIRPKDPSACSDAPRPEINR